jgi:hypothetical protein
MGEGSPFSFSEYFNSLHRHLCELKPKYNFAIIINSLNLVSCHSSFPLMQTSMFPLNIVMAALIYSEVSRGGLTRTWFAPLDHNMVNMSIVNPNCDVQFTTNQKYVGP